MTDRAELCRRADAGEVFDFVFFWGHTAKTDRDGLLVPGIADTSCFSQWSAASFVVDKVFYRTAEHFMMASKARLFGDEEARRSILAAETPAQAMGLGRGVAGFDSAIWDRERFAVVVRGSIEKFRQNPALHDVLLGTGDRVLVEAAPRDVIWGIGLSRDNPKALDPRTWRGQNLLGFALMEARATLRRERASAPG